MELEFIEKVFFLLFGFRLVFYIGLVVEVKELFPFLKKKTTLFFAPFSVWLVTPSRFWVGSIFKTGTPPLSRISSFVHDSLWIDSKYFNHYWEGE